MYDVFLTRDARRFYENADPVLARKLNRCCYYSGVVDLRGL